MRHLIRASLLLSVLALAGCTAARPEPSPPAAATVAPAPTAGADTETEAPAPALPTPTAVPEATIAQEEPAAEAPEAQVAWADVSTVDGDYFVRGNPAAPIRLIDFSDFL